MTVLDQRKVTTNLVTMLQAATSRPGADMVPPEAAELPYFFVIPIAGGPDSSGPALTAPDADVGVVYQVTSVGARRDQSEWMADKVRQAILGRNPDGSFVVAFPVVPGLSVADRRPDGGRPGTDRQGDGRYATPERYVLHLTPSS